MDLWEKSHILRRFYLLAETVKKGTWDPITSMLINIHMGKYASLDHWYNHISIEQNGLELKNDYDGQVMTLKTVDKLHWFVLDTESEERN